MIKLPDFLPKDSRIRFLDQPQIQRFQIRVDQTAAARFGLGTPGFFDYVKQDACRSWEELTDGLHVKVLDCGTVPVVGRHYHSDTETDPDKLSSCIGCIIEKKAAEGRPVVRVLVKALRDVQPVELVEVPATPQQHKKKRWMSETYHKRIQKKWNKKVAGQIELKPKQEIVTISMTKAAFRAIADKFSGRY